MKEIFKVRKSNGPTRVKKNKYQAMTRLNSDIPRFKAHPRKSLLTTEALSILKALEAVKPLYSRLDELTLKLKEMDLSGSGLMVVDNYAEKNTVFKATAIRRFELKAVGVKHL